MPTRNSVRGVMSQDEKWMTKLLQFFTASMGESTFTMELSPVLSGAVKRGVPSVRLHVISAQGKKFVIQNMTAIEEVPQLLRVRQAAQLLLTEAPMKITVTGRNGLEAPVEVYQVSRDGRVHVVSVDGVEAETDVRIMVPMVAGA